MWHLFLMQTWSSDTRHIAFRFRMIKTWASSKQAQWGIPEYSLSVKDAPNPHGTLRSLPCFRFHQLPYSENNIPIYLGAFIVASNGMTFVCLFQASQLLQRRLVHMRHSLNTVVWIVALFSFVFSEAKYKNENKITTTNKTKKAGQVHFSGRLCYLDWIPACLLSCFFEAVVLKGQSPDQHLWPYLETG